MHDSFHPQAVQDALAIMKALLIKGHLPKDDLLHSRYAGAGQREVQTLVHDHFAPLWNVVVVPSHDGLHLFVAPGNTEIGLRADELRERLESRTPTASELNLYLFVMMMVACMAQGDVQVTDSTIYFRDEDIVQFADSKLQLLAAAPTVEAVEAEHALDIRGVAQRWFDMQAADERDPARTQKHRLGVVHKVLRFWQEEDLIHLEADGRVFPRPRLQLALASYYGDSRRKEKLMGLFQGLEGLDLARQHAVTSHVAADEEEPHAND